MTGAPRNLGVNPLTVPVSHFGAPCWPFWIFEVFIEGMKESKTYLAKVVPVPVSHFGLSMRWGVAGCAALQSVTECPYHRLTLESIHDINLRILDPKFDLCKHIKYCIPVFWKVRVRDGLPGFVYLACTIKLASLWEALFHGIIQHIISVLRYYTKQYYSSNVII